jgi:hypothetical protein
MKNIGVFGGGIAGLTVAHQLIKRGFKVDVYESNPVLGGLARTERRIEDDGLPTETSWRGIGPFYYNFFNLLKEIPNKDRKKSLFDTELSDQIQFTLPLNKINGLTSDGFSVINHQEEYNNAYNWLDRFTFFDKFYLFYNMFKYLSSDERRKTYQTINICEMMKKNMSTVGYQTARSLLGPFAGLDPQSASFSHIAHFFEMQIIEYIRPSKEGRGHWGVFKQPTSESWIEPWKLHLENLGVKFYLQHKLEKININSNIVNSVNILDNQNQTTTKSFDYYVMAINPFIMQEIISKNKILSNDSQLKMFEQLTSDGPHIQVSFTIGFEDEIKWPGERTCVALPDSPFNISLYRQDELWHKDTDLGNNIKSLWSGTGCIGYQPGILFNKPVTQLKKDEFFQEVVAQIYSSEQFNSMIKLSFSGNSIESFPIKKISTWHSWKFVCESNEELLSNSEPISEEIELLSSSEPISEEIELLSSSEPKWLTTINNSKFRPTAKTCIKNLVLSGAHTKTTMNLYSMESAVESGLNSTNVILDQCELEPVKVHLHLPPSQLKILQKIDNLLYKLGLPNVIDLILI